MQAIVLLPHAHDSSLIMGFDLKWALLRKSGSTSEERVGLVA
jgi:hypothetical protein